MKIDDTFRIGLNDFGELNMPHRTHLWDEDDMIRAEVSIEIENTRGDFGKKYIVDLHKSLCKNISEAMNEFHPDREDTQE